MYILRDKKWHSSRFTFRRIYRDWKAVLLENCILLTQWGRWVMGPFYIRCSKSWNVWFDVQPRKHQMNFLEKSSENGMKESNIQCFKHNCKNNDEERKSFWRPQSQRPLSFYGFEFTRNVLKSDKETLKFNQTRFYIVIGAYNEFFKNNEKNS
jgi:hypothetical protein